MNPCTVRDGRAAVVGPGKREMQGFVLRSQLGEGAEQRLNAAAAGQRAGGADDPGIFRQAEIFSASARCRDSFSAASLAKAPNSDSMPRLRVSAPAVPMIRAFSGKPRSFLQARRSRALNKSCRIPFSSTQAGPGGRYARMT